MQPFIITHNISKSFGGVHALKDLSITINPGEIRCLAGENGSGKSTFIKIIAGVYKPDRGDIIINYRYYRYLQPMDSIRAGIQVIYQDFSLFPNLTIAENLAINTLLEHHRHLVSWREVTKIAQAALAQLGLALNLKKTVADLPVAGKQLVAISRALLHNTKLIIMDEPTTALTQREVDSLFQIIKKLKQNGISILFVSHKLTEVMEIAEQITVLRNGQKVAEGATSEFDLASLTYYMTGHKLSEQRYSYQGKKENTRLRVENLTKKNKFNDVSFTVYPGEILGITGLLGSGRTDLALSLFGLVPADSGKISINEKAVTIASVHVAIQNGIGYLPEDRLAEGLFLQQAIDRNIFICVLKSFSKWGFVNLRKARAMAQNWVDQLNISTPALHLPAQILSGGNQQKLVLAKWLATKAKILILNGPTVGVDIGAKMALHAKILKLANNGLGIIMLSDDLPEIIQVCNRILLMHKGEIVDEFQAGACNENQLMIRMRQLSISYTC